MNAVPPRLHVIQAIACDKALILRRGPSNHVASILWDRNTDDFQTGQWLKGRIYEHRSDLSPDGRHMIYFAGNGKRWWTVISRAPYLRALNFYPQDSTWHGGGAFDAQGRVWFNGSQSNGDLGDGLNAADIKAFPHATDGFHMGDMYVTMMRLRGWDHVSGSGYDAVLAKELGGGQRLELGFEIGASNRSIISHRYTVSSPKNSVQTVQEGWEWAEPCDGGLQFAAHGGLHQTSLNPDGAFSNQKLIRDFRDMSFEAYDAPYDGILYG